MTFSICPAQARDVPTMLRFDRDLKAFEKVPDAVGATEPMLLEAIFGMAPAAEALILEQNDRPVGGLRLDDFYVEPEARGLGAGAAMLERLARIAADRGYARFEWLVLDWNEPAIGIYRSRGAVLQDGWVIQRVEGEALALLQGCRSGLAAERSHETSCGSCWTEADGGCCGKGPWHDEQSAWRRPRRAAPAGTANLISRVR